MCKLSYTAHRSCSCQYFHQEPEYCEYVKQLHRGFQGGTPEWTPQVLIHDATETLNHKVGNQIRFKTQDMFDPIRHSHCKHEYFRQDVEEQCPWHNAEQTSQLRARMQERAEERAKEARKREEKEKKDAIGKKVKQILGAVCYPVNTR